MIEWKEYKIIDIGKTITGTTPSSKNPEHFGNLVSFVTPTDFKNFNKYIESTDRYLSKKGVDNLKSRILPANSIIVTCIGSDMGKIAINKIPCVTNQQINSIILNNEIADSNFVYYKLISIYSFLRNLATGGSTMPIINKTEFENIAIELPPLLEQRAIAKILSCLDNKIELNRKMNQTLEQIAQAIFKHWFIDFEFPNEEGNPYKSSGGEMVDSELGEIPRGWKIQSISKLISVKDGTHESPKPCDMGYPLITSKHIKENGIDYAQAYLISEEDYNSVNKRSKVDCNDTLITMIGTVGNIILVQDDPVKFAIKNVGLFKTSENDKLTEYLYYFLRSKYSTVYFKSHSAGTTQQYLTLNTLRNAPIIMPEKNLIEKFKRTTNALLEKKYLNQKQSDTLMQIRDILLPKLISGKIRVKTDE